jgi:protein TonB
LVACSDKNDAQKANEAAQQTQAQKPQSAIDRLVQFPEKDLRDNARKATMEQRWYKPSGNNALEYYLALKIKLKKPDETVDLALVDILPYAVIGMDQAIAQFDDKEALRLESLIRMADPNAPALARVKTDLEKMKVRQAQAVEADAEEEKTKAEQEEKALADAAKAKLEAANKAKEQATQTTPVSAAPTPAAAPPTVAQQAPAAVTQQAPPPQAPTPTAKSSITPINTPQPPYPKEAMASGAKGEVVVDISINEIGDVTNVAIVSSKPGKTFDKTVLNTVRKWRYRGNGEATTVRRTFVFN